jgi:hypothetical protein
MFKSYAIVSAIVILFTGGFVSAQGGLPDIGIRSNLALGIVKNVGDKKITLETKDGMIDVVILDATQFKRLPPDKLVMSAATDAAFTDITAGDRLLVTGKVSDDRKSIYSNKVFLVKNSDVQARAAKRREEWRRRGISGKVSAVDPVLNTISIGISSVTGANTTVKVSPNEDVRYLRYSGSSVKYSDAVESDFKAIKAGDTFQALGERSEDGKGFAAEEVITGSFVTVAGAVKSIDIANNIVTISDLKTKQDISIAIMGSSVLKRFPEEVAQRLARFQMMQRMGGGAGRDGNRGAKTGKSGRPRQGGNRRAGGGRRNMDINQLLNRFPAITVSDLKVGELIAASSPKGDDPTKVTAIKLLAGVGPFLMMRAPSGSRRGRGVSGGINIPGLDSVNF